MRTQTTLPTAAFFLGAAALLTLLPNEAFAQSALFDSGTNFLTALMDLLTGTWARILGIIAVFGVGAAWLTGRLSLYWFASVVGGVVLILSAPAIVDGISSVL